MMSTTSKTTSSKSTSGKAAGSKTAAGHKITDKSIMNAQKLRAAMDRLLAGQPLHTDGRLTVRNLASEAGLSRPAAYRCEDVIAEFSEHMRRLSERSEVPSEKHLQKIVSLQHELKSEREKSARYLAELKAAQGGKKALANQIMVLGKKS